ncbi:MAG: hypothetical protein P8X47_03540 [Ignavibacteriaceae bacterium]
MYPDYYAIVNEFIKPVVFIFIFAFLILGWVSAFTLMKENTLLRIKLGKEEVKIKEDFKVWLLRKSAPFVFQFYSVKFFLWEEEIQPLLKQIVKKKKKILKLAFRLDIAFSIISSTFRLASARINWGVRKQ